ncbi:MAG TPA: serine/threonine-protein kinase [Anaerolineales bacterium]|nr:serine/threonine-protein kinase [Anaerolineales bacterium]
MAIDSSSLSLNALSPGLLFKQYKLLERIGVGGQGVVWSALGQGNNLIYAIKFSEILDPINKIEAIGIRDEHHLDELVKLRHDYILPLTEYGFEKGLRFTVSPYIPGGTLAEKIKASSLSPGEILRYGMKIASALDYLHSQEIIHRDLKSSNILLDLKQNTFLADFGLARLVTKSTLALHTGHGTPPYAPPEQVQSKAISPRSDIFSFGIMLYEMFTGQLPWGGKKQLGMEQTHSKQELPDPREFNENLPSQLVDALRQVTAADPQLRPRSASAVMNMLYYIYKISPDNLLISTEQNKLAIDNDVSEELLSYGLERWHATDGKYNLGLTKFTLIDLQREKINLNIYGRFMLFQSLTYGSNDDQWWSIVNNPRVRLAVSSELLQKKNDSITARIIGHLINDTDFRLFPEEMTEDMVASLLEIGINSVNVFLRQQIFDGIRILTQPNNAWNHTSQNTDQMKQLGIEALEDSEAGDTAAELVGHLRSTAAIQVILDYPDEERKYDTLLLIQKTAGSLPSIVQGGIRFRLSIDAIINRLVQQPVSLISAYVLAFLGSALGIGIQVYLTYRLPDFFDIARITTSLEQGLIVGSVFGLGIFMTRVVMERFHSPGTFLRLIFGTIAGWLGLNVSLFIFHVLFLNTPPMGLLITAGCIFISLIFSVNGLLRSRIIRIILSIASIFIAIMGTWLIHVNSAASSVELTPIFRYDYAWPLTQISSTAFWVAAFIGIFGNLIDLSVVDE